MKKKKKVFFFYSDRVIKLYDNGYFGYYTHKSEKLKALVAPGDLK